MSIWEYSAPTGSAVRQLRRTLGVSRTVAELLVQVGIKDREEAEVFLDPRLRGLRDPFEIPNLKRAVHRICQAIDGGQRIVICGDYDVDGVTSTTLLVSVLRQFDSYPDFVVPLRLEEGYGLTEKAAERAMGIKGGADLFIGLDCGTNASEVAQFILDKGCDLIIVDHHQSKSPLPDEVVLVNPHVEDCGQGDGRSFCTVGLVFKLSHGLLKARRNLDDKRAFKIKLREYLDLVAMGTVADLVPLRGENRIFARIGLEVMSSSRRVGLKCLMKISGINPKSGIKPIDISFKIGPRINASGRLADAGLAVELLLTEDRSYAMETSLQLDSYNRERQEIERAMTDEAFEIVESDQLDCQSLLVYGDDWHPGVVGIVASRVSRAYNRPSIVLGREGDLAKGSGRSVGGVNLVKALDGFSHELENYGGHPMAVGVALKVDKVGAFREYFEKAIGDILQSDREELSLNLSAWVEIDEIDAVFMNELARVQPFGMENPEPVFAARSVMLHGKPRVFNETHFRFNLAKREGPPLQGIAWKLADRIPPLNQPFDIAFRVGWNDFAGRRNLQVELVDWQLSSAV